MEDALGYNRGHWRPPLGDCLHRIAPVAARVIGLSHTTKVVVYLEADVRRNGRNEAKRG